MKIAGIIETKMHKRKKFLSLKLVFMIFVISFLKTHIVLSAVAKCKTRVNKRPLFLKKLTFKKNLKISM
tara:strand:+ start:689 stop:895 length:207 start_codon:yes stop_codon:yes gene_type:complete